MLISQFMRIICHQLSKFCSWITSPMNVLLLCTNEPPTITFAASYSSAYLASVYVVPHTKKAIITGLCLPTAFLPLNMVG